MSEEARQRIEDLELAAFTLVRVTDWLLAYVKKTGNAREVSEFRADLDRVRDLLAEDPS